ncbi:MAG: FAD-dependent oxidoreductase [Pseudomonadota bacterium]
MTSFSFEGRTVDARPDDTIASAITRAGCHTLRVTRHGDPRGIFCGMGVCHDCLVTVDGRVAQRACMTKAAGASNVAIHQDGVASGAAWPASDPPPPMEETVDLVIIGAGPAGIAAALTAARAGVSPVLLDERATAGGQYFKAPAEGARLDRQHREGARQRAALAAANVEHRADALVWFADRDASGITLGVFQGGRGSVLRAKAVILATGAYERPPIVPGWTLPGVMTIGAAQSLLRSGGALPGTRIAIASEGPLGLQLAAELVRAGAPPVMVAERGRPHGLGNLSALLQAIAAAPRLVIDGAAAFATLARAGVPFRAATQLVRCEGEGRVARAVLEPVGGGAEMSVSVDAVCVGEGFLPQVEVARLLGCEAPLDPAHGAPVPVRDADGATSVLGVFVAGDAGGLGGARVAAAEGAVVGTAALRFLGGQPTPVSRRALQRARRFQKALWSIYRAPARGEPAAEAMLCRCEGVRVADAAAAIASGARDLGALKRLTRLGMGRCQGRYCSGPAAQMLGAAEGFAPQAPTKPVPIAAFAIEKPEWGGHRQTPQPRLRPVAPRRAPPPPVPPRAELVIIGGGVMGISAALTAAERGVDTVLIERGTLNGESSGGNAGSLHLQLLSFDFGEKTGGRSARLLETLPLQRDAIALWNALNARADTDFEIAVTGGLMLAEEEAHVGFLKAKVAAENSVGIEASLVGREEIAAIAPNVSPRMIAGAWCPGEGKINPLAATPALARLAARAGAALLERVEVRGLSTLGNGTAVTTNAGTIIADRLILAAGGWTAQLAAHLGVALPIHGAPLQMIVTECAPPLAPCLLAHADRHLTMKQAAVGNIILGGAWSAGTDDATGRAKILRESFEGNLWVGARVLPALRGFHALRAWAAMNVDIDGAPLVGPLPGHPRVTVVAGANGYTLGPLLGAAAAECALNGWLGTGLRAFSANRFAA